MTPNTVKIPDIDVIMRITADNPGVTTNESSLQVEKTVVISVLTLGVTILINGIFPIISSISIPRVARTSRIIPRNIFVGIIPIKKKHIPDIKKLYKIDFLIPRYFAN